MNTAARLQSGASSGSVLIGEPTYLLVRDAVLADALEPLVAKGKAEPVAEYQVLEVLEHTRRLPKVLPDSLWFAPSRQALSSWSSSGRHHATEMFASSASTS